DPRRRRRERSACVHDRGEAICSDHLGRAGWHEHLRGVRRWQSAWPGQTRITLRWHPIAPGLKQLPIGEASAADHDRGDHPTMSEHRLHTRDRMMQTLLRALPEQARLVVRAVIDSGRHDAYLADTGTGPLGG